MGGAEAGKRLGRRIGTPHKIMLDQTTDAKGTTSRRRRGVWVHRAGRALGWRVCQHVAVAGRMPLTSGVDNEHQPGEGSRDKYEE